LDELVQNRQLFVAGQQKGWIDQKTFSAYAREIVKFSEQQRHKHGLDRNTPFCSLLMRILQEKTQRLFNI